MLPIVPSGPDWQARMPMLKIPPRRSLIWLAIAFVAVMGGWAIVWVAGVHAPDLRAQVHIARAALEQTRRSHTVAYSADEITAAPYETDELKARKVLFLAKMLPLVVAENNRILKQRAAAQRTTSATHLNALALAHGLKPTHVSKTALLKRIDIVPPSLVLAQAAIESAWGTSRFARQGNAFFGERTYDPDASGLTPKRASGFKVKSFATAQASVRSYMRTLNSHQAYRALREHRAAQRATGQPLNGPELTAYLKAYSQLGGKYISMIKSTIIANRLDDFDTLVSRTE